MRLLLIEDDETISRNVAVLLQHASFAVDTALTYEEGYQKATDEPYDLLIVDWMLPDGSGQEMVTRLKKEKIPSLILLLTSRTQSDDVVLGLNSGADDYVSKPFSQDVLLARIRALLRRSDRMAIAPLLHIDDMSIDTNTHEVKRNGQVIPLSPKEYSLLEYLVIHSGVAIDRMTILSHVWDEQADTFSNTVDVHIRYLRKKIDEGHKTNLIHTVKGKGYMLCDH
jgi:DNA-binding response OmpR family regulator